MLLFVNTSFLWLTLFYAFRHDSRDHRRGYDGYHDGYDQFYPHGGYYDGSYGYYVPVNQYYGQQMTSWVILFPFFGFIP